jgi:hypothetical protein
VSALSTLNPIEVEDDPIGRRATVADGIDGVIAGSGEGTAGQTILTV